MIKYDFENVYPPSEDTYLIIDYFKRKLSQTHFDGLYLSKLKNILDLGTGTGILAIFFQLIISQNMNFKANIVASDILEEAINCAKENETLNKIQNKIQFIRSEMFNSFPENLRHVFNIIVFNPPYLPSAQIINNDNRKNIDSSWNGGFTGFDVLIDFLKKVKYYLNLEDQHYVYFVSSSRTKLPILYKQIEKLGFKNEIVSKKHVFFEDIVLNRSIYTRS